VYPAARSCWNWAPRRLSHERLRITSGWPPLAQKPDWQLIRSAIGIPDYKSHYRAVTCRSIMQRMRFIRFFNLLLVLLSLGLPYRLEGADPHGAVCSGDPSSALIFVGKLTGWTSGGSPRWSSATFHVTELFQGESSGVVTTLMRNDLCDPTIGRTYLVLTHSLPNGSVYQLEDCEQIRPVDQATAALEYLRGSQRGNTSTEVSGEARVETRGYPWKKIPLPKTRIHLVGQNQQLDFVSDEDGRFHGTLNSGQYAISAEFPTGYEAELYETEHCGPSPITVTEHRCTQVTVCAHPTASITAHIVDVGGGPLGPMSNVQLTLETAEDNQFVQSVWPNEKSTLEANNLLPGRYILGLNTYLPVSRGSPYPPIYFPGVATRSEAQVITLSAGEHKVLSEMRIKKGQECEIPVLVIDSSGRPSPSAAVGLAYRDYPHFYIEPHEQTDENGKEIVYAVFPGPVFLRADKGREDGSMVKSENLELSSCPSEPVSLKLSRVVVDQPESEKK